MRASKTLVFANGVFDLYHAGHVNFLKQARTFGDVLIVGIPDDETVRELKGKDRPVWNQHAREGSVARHPGVATTIVYSGRVSAVLRAIRPDVLVRGEDQRLDGAEHAGRVVRVPRTPNISTTQLINQCDGCRAGIPVDKNGNHQMGKPGGYPDYMACTKDRYASGS